jgi:hypothetical protein
MKEATLPFAAELPPEICRHVLSVGHINAQALNRIGTLHLGLKQLAFICQQHANHLNTQKSVHSQMPPPNPDADALWSSCQQSLADLVNYQTEGPIQAC